MTAQTRATNPIFGPQPFKLGVFTFSHRGGGMFTTVPERWQAEWDDIAKLAKMADRAGIDFMLPLSGWVGWKGEVDHRCHSFETLTLAATLAGITERIGIFSTVAIPFFHPLMVAKAMTTIDHASHGRSGLNIVCTWNPDESQMFGQEMLEHDLRYDHAAEWVSIFDRCLQEGHDKFDFDGNYVRGKGIFNQPKSLQQPRPAVLNAAFSDPGRDFAVRHADVLLTAGTSIDKIPAELADLEKRAAAANCKRPEVFNVTTVVCRPDRKEAEEYNDRYSKQMADKVVIQSYIDRRRKGAAMMDMGTLEKQAQFHAGGADVAGTPEDVADHLISLKQAGYAGTALQFVNFLDELPYFVSEVLPLMEKDGLRLPVAEAAGRESAQAEGQPV